MSKFSPHRRVPVDELPAIFVDQDGKIEYPSIVPPHVDFPQVSPGGTTSQRRATISSHMVDRSKGNRYPSALSPDGAPAPATISPLQSSNKISPVAGHGSGVQENGLERSSQPTTYLNYRPSAVSGRHTGQPTSGRRYTVPNIRKETEVSTPNGIGREHPNEGGYISTTSTSSSETSDEDEGPQMVGTRRRSMTGLGRNRTLSITKSREGSNTDAKPYSNYKRFHIGNDKYESEGKVSKNDGRLKISLSDTSNTGYLAKALGASFRRGLRRDRELATDETDEAKLSSKYGPSGTCFDPGFVIKKDRLPLKIVIMVIGSRGDIQPFLKIGKLLKEKYGHRVRIATHPAFRDFVEHDSGLEFFSVGGDPAELMAFMVKNPGMIPTMETLKKGEVGRRRSSMAQMFDGFWRACINATDDEHDVNNLKMMGSKGPFIADAIIANPPSFAHIHCAERLGIPLHLMFTFPYTPTLDFPHPLAHIKRTNVDPGYTNFMSYPLVEMMTWQGLGDLVNDFRVKTLGLEPVSTLWAPGQLYRLRVPYTYLWSPSLVPKPKDWGPEINIAGFVFLDLASSFDPPESLVEFLASGEAPVYIGFGSIVVDNPDKFTQMIYKAVEMAGVRALVSKGWGGFGGDDSPKNVYLLDNTPHDWLFPKVRAVVHHGGAGTTAAGLKYGKPTLIVPFFGDQFFWGNMIAKAGSGAEAIPYKELTAEKLADGIKVLLEEETQEAADKIAKRIEEEGDGAENAVKKFHRDMSMRSEESMRCSILEDRLAVWSLKKTNLRLSALAADFLVATRKIRWQQLRLLRHVEWNDFEGPGEPVSGGASSIAGNLASAATGLGSIPIKLARSAKKRKRHAEKKKRKELRATAKAGQKWRERQSGHGQIGSIETSRDLHRVSTNLSNQQLNGPEPTISARDMLPSSQPPNIVAARQDQESAEQIQGGRAEESQTEADQYYTDDDESVLTTENSHTCADEIADDIAGGLVKSGGALITAPIDFSTAISQGFHNAPRLYGDETVRRPVRITGLQSGLKAAGKEFVYGIYDSWTGLIILPYDEARRDGLVGLIKGSGMGITGFVLKHIAAITGPFAYTAKGLQKELHKSKQPTQFIRRARIIEGQRDLVAMNAEMRASAAKKVSHGWEVMEKLWQVMADERRHGIFGRIKAVRDRKTWRMEVKFDNVYMAERALQALHRGDGGCLGSIFEHQRRQMEEERLFSRTAARRDKDVRRDRMIRARAVIESMERDENRPAMGVVGEPGERSRGYSHDDVEKLQESNGTGRVNSVGV